MPDIRANTVLPARRRDVLLHTSDGLELVGELALPLRGTPVATLVCLHPLPTQGGFMDSHLLQKAARRLPALADLAVLRFNTRGTTSPRGTSQGSFDGGVGEKYDVAAALDLCEAEDLPAIWLLGGRSGPTSP
jgi:alpha/beta superfamily hydrolase